MKHLSMWLTVLLLGSLPLAAAALDYGPNRTLLAVENGSAPQLPGTQTHSTASGTLPHPDVADADDMVVPAPAAPRASSPPSLAAPHDHGPSASNKPRHAAPPQPATESGPASWRSLLPGSIQ